LSSSSDAAGATVVYETRIDALDITILKGGAASVGQWAREHGFQLTPDAPAVLDFYARRSRIFMAARFDAKAAEDRGQAVGDGTPIHLTIPLSNPWVPLRILALGVPSDDRITADVFLLTDRKPALLPAANNGVPVLISEQATSTLLDDLRSDKGMEWIPGSMWFTHMQVGESAGKLRYDLAVDRSGRNSPSYWRAGIAAPRPPATTVPTPTTTTAPPTTLAPATTRLSSHVALPASHESPVPAWPLVGIAVAALVGVGVTGRRLARR
jgi:hypothetical protein